MSIEKKAFAKINLHLEVLNKRADGFHNILSLMASVDLHDLLKLCMIDLHKDGSGDINVDIISAGGMQENLLAEIPTEDNLIYRATEVYLKSMGLAGNLQYSLQKNIPAGAGLGGGSADAAAALLLLNRHLSACSDEELSELGSRIGADVPFCLKGGLALCRGIGEIIEPVSSQLKPSVLIANPGVHINTASAYRSLNRDMLAVDDNKIQIKAHEIKSALSQGSIHELRSILVNDFEKFIFSEYPDIGLLKDRIYKLGADFALMTGSGSSVIGLFSNYDVAEDARLSLISENISQVLITQFVSSA